MTCRDDHRFPPFDEDSARQKVQAAEDAWNTRDPERPPPPRWAPCRRCDGHRHRRPGRNTSRCSTTSTWWRAFGWQVGEELTISVVRNGVTIGTARGPVVITPEGPGLEVNHEATTVPPAPGSCWDSYTPDIRPGDVVTATNGTETDEVTVDDLRFSGDPYLDEATGDVLVQDSPTEVATASVSARSTPSAPASHLPGRTPYGLGDLPTRQGAPHAGGLASNQLAA